MVIKMNKLLLRKFYEYDDTFYSHKASIDCWEQMKYQSLRDHAVDYFLVFCEDINIKLRSFNGVFWIISPNCLEYNDNLFRYVTVTENALEAEIAIEQIVEMGKVAIFQAAMDCLHSCVWFHEEEPFVKTRHNAIIVGYDEHAFFYVDSPPMRNALFFVPHPDNPAVGCISRSELRHSFGYHCKIGYIDININKLNNIAGITKILNGIKSNFYSADINSMHGKNALLMFCNLLNGDKIISQIYNDIFAFNLITSRHKKLKINIQKYEDHLSRHFVNKADHILITLIEKWTILENLATKVSLTKDIKTQKRMAKLIQDEILPQTEKFISMI